jgi:hypothetical protein
LYICAAAGRIIWTAWWRVFASHIRSAEGVKIADYEYSDGTFERNTKLGVPDNADLNAVFAADILARLFMSRLW